MLGPDLPSVGLTSRQECRDPEMITLVRVGLVGGWDRVIAGSLAAGGYRCRRGAAYLEPTESLEQASVWQYRKAVRMPAVGVIR
jgi:hypothetical protein